MARLQLDKAGIEALMPHRSPMLLIERAELSDSGEAKGTYAVKGDEYFLQGHFPDNPVVPGVILCEMLAQTACVLFSEYGGCTPVFTSIDKTRFKNPVKPGDTVETSVRQVRAKSIFRFCEGTLTVGGKVCCQSAFSFAIIPPKIKI